MSESKWVAEAMRLCDAWADAEATDKDTGGFSLVDVTEAYAAIRAHLQRQADLMERMGEALADVAKSGEFTCFNDFHWDTVNAALTAFQESKQ